MYLPLVLFNDTLNFYCYKLTAVSILNNVTLPMFICREVYNGVLSQKEGEPMYTVSCASHKTGYQGGFH